MVKSECENFKPLDRERKEKKYIRLFRKIGTAPSQTAQAEIPACQKVSSPSICILFAVAPLYITEMSMDDQKQKKRNAYVATMRESAVIAADGSSSVPSTQTLKGRDERSTFEIVSVRTSVPNLTLCSRILTMSSGPERPSGKPGTFYGRASVTDFQACAHQATD
jgi:hypothetical protein